MRSAAKSRTSVRASAARKDEDVQVDEVATGVAGVAAAAVVFGAPDAAMADAYTDYLEAMKAQNIEPASVTLPAEAPALRPSAGPRRLPPPQGPKAPKVAAPKVDKEAAAAAKAEAAAKAAAEG